MTDETILAAEGLAKTFRGIVAVDGVDLNVRRGSIHALIGPNGAGKTTCFNLLTKFLTPTRGRITFDGQEFAIGEYRLRSGSEPPPGAIPIAVAREKGPALIHHFSGLVPGDRVLALTPLVQFEGTVGSAEEPQVERLPSALS